MMPESPQFKARSKANPWMDGWFAFPFQNIMNAYAGGI
jgi:hypothetical protein